ncbi:MAG: hypothetical protein QOI80_2379 [Solirubrobacteraceae bacterium]|nr:hypothetical protein [Solirubrobacteraceae bacterium]
MTATLTAPPAAPASADAGHPRRWLILFVVLAAECMDLLDATIVNVAAPSIRADLGASLSALQWVVGGYSLAFAVGLITGGRLGDMYGRRKLFLIGAAGFTAASVLCGAVQSPGMLIATRLAQGAFGALLIPQGFGIIKQVFPPDELPKAFGLFGPVMGMAALASPIIGGGLVDADLFGTGWRMVFLVNLPLGGLALLGAVRVLPESRAAVKPKLDLPGMALITVAAAALMYPLIQGREEGWPTWMYASMVAGVALLGGFGFYIRARSRAGGDPLVLPSIFRRRAFSGGLVVGLVSLSSIMGLLLVFTLYLQLGLGFSAIHAGLTLIPFSLFVAVGAGMSGGFLAAKFGRPVITAGLLVLVAGVVAMIATVHGETTVTSWDVVPPQILLGLGFGLFVAPYFDTVLAAVDDDEVGSASGTLNAIQQLGGATGVAALGTLFFSVLPKHGFGTAFEHTLWLSAGLLAVSVALSFILPRWAREPVL